MRQIFVFLLGLWITSVDAQPVEAQRSTRVPVHERSNQPSTIPLTSIVRINRPTAFTDHQLAGRVDPGKKHSYNESIEGRTVSRPSPTTHQIPSP